MVSGKKTFPKKWRILIVITIAVLVGGYLLVSSTIQTRVDRSATAAQSDNPNLATYGLGKLAVKVAAPHDGYNRDLFGSGWATVGNCDMREQILNRDLTGVNDKSKDDCTVLSGTLTDSYTGKWIQFTRGPGTSSAVQIDHIVAVSNAWQTGAKGLTMGQRTQLYNDPLELLAVSGTENQAKSDADASEWLPPNKSYDCRYVARQIAVKMKYHLWITQPEHDAMQNVLKSCPSQMLPVVSRQ